MLEKALKTTRGGASTEMPDAAREIARLNRLRALERTLSRAELDLGQFRQMIVDRLVEDTSASGVVVEMATAEHMVYCATDADHESFLGFQLPRAGSLSGLCVELAQTLYCRDAASDPRVDRAACERIGLRSMICAPLISGGQGVGVLKLFSDRVEAFPPGEVEFLDELASMLGAALDKQIAFDALRAEVAARETAESRLALSEARLERIIDDVRNAVIVAGEDGRVTCWNRAAQEIFGWTPTEALGQRLLNLIVPQRYRAARARKFKQLVAAGNRQGVGRRLEMRAMRKDGSEFEAELALSATRGPGGWLVTVLVHDISERKADSDHFESAFRHAAIGMALVGLDGRLLRVNDALCDLLDASREELQARDFRSITHPDDLQADLEALAETLAGRIASYRMDKRYLRSNGDIVWGHLTVSLVRHSDGSPKHFVSQIEDITARVEAEHALRLARSEALAAKDQAQAASEAKSQFLANMSHELRTPLTSIIGFAGLMREEQSLDATQRLYAERIATASDHLLGVINDVLDYSKLEANAIELDPAPFAFEPFIRSTAELVSAQAAAKGLDLVIDMADQQTHVRGDSHRLRQAILNLLTNAIKFTDRGRVTLRASAVRTEAGFQIVCDVQDTGVGIAEDKIATLFERFVQADGGVSRRFGGTGLGLSISRELLRLMGGDIVVRSRSGEGSIFGLRCTLPGAEPIVRAPAVSAARGGLSGLRVLVADDVAANRDLIGRLLAAWEVETVCVNDGAEAVAAVRGSVFDLVLMDLQMPVMDGLSATRCIRNLSTAAAHIQIIALTAEVDAKRVVAIRAAGMDDHLAKPINVQNLYAAIARVAAERSDRDEAPDILCA